MEMTAVLLAGVALLSAVSAAESVQPENLARGKSYRLSREPNYALSKDAGDAVQLTDGTYAGKDGHYMWTDLRAVTWSKCSVFSRRSWERFKSKWEKQAGSRKRKPPRMSSCGGSLIGV